MTKEEHPINKLCKKLGWTRSELAKRMRLSKGTIDQAASNPKKFTEPMQAHIQTLFELAEVKNKIEP